MNTPQFDHEKLRAYQEALKFAAWVEPIIELLPHKLAARDQLDRASTSIVLNIAEGNGKFTEKDRCRYFDTAHGSALECAAGLDVLVAKKKATSSETFAGKERLHKIVQMLIGLIKRNSSREYARTDS